MERKKLLLVEDNHRDEALAVRAFKKGGIVDEIVVVRDGVEAVDYLFGTGTHSSRAAVPLPQLILLDLKLPKINGLEVLQRIRADERTRRIPVIVFTSSTEEEDVFQSYELGANSYVTKPVDFENFNDAAKQLIAYWMILNRTAQEKIR